MRRAVDGALSLAGQAASLPRQLPVRVTRWANLVGTPSLRLPAGPSVRAVPLVGRFVGALVLNPNGHFAPLASHYMMPILSMQENDAFWPSCYTNVLGINLSTIYHYGITIYFYQHLALLLHVKRLSTSQVLQARQAVGFDLVLRHNIRSPCWNVPKMPCVRWPSGTPGRLQPDGHAPPIGH